MTSQPIRVNAQQGGRLKRSIARSDKDSGSKRGEECPSRQRSETGIKRQTISSLYCSDKRVALHSVVSKMKRKRVAL